MDDLKILEHDNLSSAEPVISFELNTGTDECNEPQSLRFIHSFNLTNGNQVEAPIQTPPIFEAVATRIELNLVDSSEVKK